MIATAIFTVVPLILAAVPVAAVPQRLSKDDIFCLDKATETVTVTHTPTVDPLSFTDAHDLQFNEHATTTTTTTETETETETHISTFYVTPTVAPEPIDRGGKHEIGIAYIRRTAFIGLAFIGLPFSGIAYTEIAFVDLAFIGFAFVGSALVGSAYIGITFLGIALWGIALGGYTFTGFAFSRDCDDS
ncbi:hypothetical protein VPNG_01777 [Cytospora leucostoma]|uniref:Uncharacterized protein n=1 Tax=Cytospora leucostoma TaxID=1230097 RepID=A0A423XIW8_9PEZI|nr:hypothetical protein VPNG_01777 [Cytospora leucostoma]